jgi:hypothetical protein
MADHHPVSDPPLARLLQGRPRPDSGYQARIPRGYQAALEVMDPSRTTRQDHDVRTNSRAADV